MICSFCKRDMDEPSCGSADHTRFQWKVLCLKDHMHRWERSATTTNLVCTAGPRDNPAPQDAEMAHAIENIEWVSVKLPVLETLTEMIASAKKDIQRDAHSQFLAALHAEQSPIWLEAARNHEAKKDLYGNYRNYQTMVSAIQDLNQRARHDRVSTNNTESK